MKFCKDCWNFDRCNAIGRTVDFAVDDGVCREFDECKPQTNADRIRAMSDEELAKFLYTDPMCEGQRYCSEYGCEDCILDWLRQPVKDGDNDG